MVTGAPVHAVAAEYTQRLKGTPTFSCQGFCAMRPYIADQEKCGGVVIRLPYHTDSIHIGC